MQKKALEGICIGAFARDIIFEHHHKIASGRATMDIDIAIQVRDWQSYDELRTELTTEHSFTYDATQPQRLLFHESIMIDILPFGNIADKNNNIIWPSGLPMTVSGFEDAFSNSLPLGINGIKNSKLRLASLPALTLLKLISWNDRKQDRKRDIEDIAFIIKNHLKIENNAVEEALSSSLFDYDIHSARLLGRKIGTIVGTASQGLLLSILEREADSSGRCLLSRELRKHFKGDFQKARKISTELFAGIQDINRI